MADKKLPEMNIDKGKIAADTASLVSIRTEMVALETKEKALRTAIEEEAVKLRDEKLKAGEVIGLIRVANDRAPVRVEFKINAKKANLDVAEEENLDMLFKGSRPLLFERSTIVTEITDPEGLITALKESNRNPWDFLVLSVKPEMDSVISGYEQHTVSSDKYMPKKGFLSTLSEIWHTLSDQATDYVKEFIKVAIHPSVVVGTKGNGK